jgi:hypothetical protein
MTDVYFSADVEADGPIPGDYSMLSFAFAVAGRFDGEMFQPSDPSTVTFYRELKPISETFVPAALAVAGLDRDALVRHGAAPAVAMREAAEWVADHVESGSHPVLVAYPLVFDWTFLHWYFIRFLGESPFGFSSALDMKTMFQHKAHVTIDRAGRTDLPKELQASHPHTHNALDDAIGQAQIFSRLFNWNPVEP